MFRNPQVDKLRQSFSDQFSGDEHGLVYRKHQKGPAYRVSEAERDMFVANFGKRIRFATWIIVPATIGLIPLLLWLFPDVDSGVAQAAMWIGIAVILVPFMAIYYWAWNAPARELEGRTPESASLTKDEARALTFAKITYGQLALAALLGAGLVWKMSGKFDVLHGWGLIWPAFGALLIVVAGIQAIRKWHFDRR
ncbi:hypothetical protein [Qipengyuania sp.]|uniref:hypothetical protein n=1 Tax=Qipengyuania sp. TaxID=2004515 RepID=UPI003AF884CD